MPVFTPTMVNVPRFVLFDKDRGTYLHENPDMFVYATLQNDGRPVATEYATEAEAVEAADRAGGNVQVFRISKWVEPVA